MPEYQVVGVTKNRGKFDLKRKADSVGALLRYIEASERKLKDEVTIHKVYMFQNGQKIEIKKR